MGFLLLCWYDFNLAKMPLKDVNIPKCFAFLQRV
jgi:hypothetical protein